MSSKKIHHFFHSYITIDLSFVRGMGMVCFPICWLIAMGCAKLNVDIGVDNGGKDGGLDTSTISDTTVDTNIDTNTYTDTEINTDTGTDTNTTTDKNTDTDTSVDTFSDTNTDTGMDTDTDADADADTDTDTDTDTNSDTDTDTDGDTDTDTDADSETYTDTDSDTVQETDTSQGTETSTATATETIEDTDSETVADGKIKVLSIINDPRRDFYQISINITNDTNNSFVMNELRLHYYYTADGASAAQQTFSCWGWPLGGCGEDSLTPEFVATSGRQADTYLNLVFTSDLVIDPGGDSGTIDFGLHQTNAAEYDISNDWSYIFSDDFVENSRITVYRSNDTIPIWGEEP